LDLGGGSWHNQLHNALCCESPEGSGRRDPSSSFPVTAQEKSPPPRWARYCRYLLPSSQRRPGWVPPSFRLWFWILVERPIAINLDRRRSRLLPSPSHPVSSHLSSSQKRFRPRPKLLLVILFAHRISRVTLIQYWTKKNPSPPSLGTRFDLTA
jgi:hypothetical protein